MRTGVGALPAGDPERVTVGFEHLEWWMCRWPMWPVRPERLAFPDIRYCGCRAIEARPYCEAHEAIAHGRSVEQMEAEIPATFGAPMLVLEGDD